MVTDKKSKCIAILHDTIEDNKDIDEKFLLEKGVDKDIIYGVTTLTKKDGQSYIDYIKNIKRFPDIADIKIADMFDNLCSNPSNKQKIKYRGAMFLLKKIN